MTGPSNAPAAAWYPDPHEPQATLRWWDGTQWTAHVAPVTPAPVVASGPVLSVAQPAVVAHAEPAVGGSKPSQDVWAADRYRVRQLVRPIVNKYEVYVVDGDRRPGRSERLVAVVHQKRFRIKEKIEFRSARQELLFTIAAKTVLEVRGRYDVTLPDGTVLGRLKKDFATSLVMSRWQLMHGDDEEILATATESSELVAILRRFAGFIPFVGALVGLVMMFIPYGFDIRAEAGARRRAGAHPGSTLGTHRRRISIFDDYEVDLRGDPDCIVDRRLAIALAVGLDSLQAR